MRLRFHTTGLIGLCVLSAAAQAQTDICTGGTANSNPMIRAEGTTELVGTFSFTCTGGGATNTTVSLLLSPALAVTSKVLNTPTGATEAIAIASAGGSSNYVQGTVVHGSAVTFTGLNLPPGTATVTIANIRVNATPLPTGNGTPPVVSAQAFISGPIVNNGSGPTQVVSPYVTASVVIATVSSGLGPQSVSGVRNFYASGPISASTGPAFTFNFAENFSSAFKVQGDPTNPLNPAIENTETGYSANGALANTASSGTRVQISFANVPPGVNVYVPTMLVASSGGGTMSLTASGTGTLSPVPALNPTAANTLPASPALAQVAITSGNGSAFYELIQTLGTGARSFSVPVYISAGAGVVSTGAPITVFANLAPVGSNNLPNFVVGNSTIPLMGSVISPLTMTCNPATGPATVGMAYSTTCTAGGGVPPYGFGVTAGVPAGLIATMTSATTATITGTPTTPGMYSYGHVVHDSENPHQTATVTFTGNIAAAPGQATHLSVAAPASVPLGTAFNFMVSALDATGAAVPGYSGTVHFTSTDLGARLPPDFTFTRSDSGIHVFSATAGTAGNMAITATDTLSSISGTSGAIAVTPAAGTPVLTSLNPSTATAGGTAFTLTVTGTSFSQTALILWNGSALSTTWSSATQLVGMVPASLITAFGSPSITVIQGAATSNALPFTIFPATTTGTTRTTVLPHIAANGAWVTGFYVVNTGTAPARFNIGFFSDSGQPLSLAVAGAGSVSQITGVLPGLGSAYYEAGSASQPVTGGDAQVSADASIVVQALFRLQGNNSTYFEAAVNPGAGSKDFVVPFDATTFAPTGEQLYTGFAIANADPAQSATVTCVARDGSGTTIPNAITPPVLPSQGHWADFNFPALLGIRGTVECTSATSITALAIHSFAASGAISSLPVILK